MTKKNRKRKNSPKVEEITVEAYEKTVDVDQTEQQVDTKVVEGGENLLEADEIQALQEPVIDGSVQPEESVSSPLRMDAEESFLESTAPDEKDESSQDNLMDDLLADVRSALIEEDETGRDEKKSSWWNRLVKGPSSQDTPVAETPAELRGEVAVDAIQPTSETDAQDSEEPVKEIDELIKLLEAEEQEDQNESLNVSAPVLPPVEEEEVKVDIDDLKKQAFTRRLDEEKAEEGSDVRMVALQGEEEVFVEVETRKEDPWEERIKAIENALRPYRTFIYYGVAFIGVVMAVMALTIIYNGVKRSLPTPEPTAVVNMPYPTSVTLPGGLSFNLGKGALKNETWNPRGPEWLEGTEICRWVALPWSRPLEAAIRTMNRDDVIELVMSNNDKLSYQVESIQELAPAELQEMDSSSPCLAIILAKQDSEKRWVAVGRP
jgi:hypothetical protein